MTDDEAMSIALEEAHSAAAAGDVPVGCVVLDPSGAVLARAHNQRAVAADPTAHAEVLALREAAGKLGDWRLTGCTLVVTLEPCPMCAGALVAGRVARVVFGAPDAKGGACGSLYNLCVDPRLNHEVQVQHGVRADECAAVLTAFFAARRR
jgi:tRNA(adenine34) deaminase